MFYAATRRGDGVYRAGRRYEAPRRRAAQPSLGSELARTAIKQLNTRQGQALVRGILGSLFKGR